MADLFRRVLRSVVFALALGAVNRAAAVYTFTNLGEVTTVSNDGCNVTVTLNGNIVNWSYSIPGVSGSTGYGAWLASTTGNGGPYGVAVFDKSAVTTLTASGSFTATAGLWYQIAARKNTNNNSNVYDVIGYFQVGVTQSPVYKVTISVFNGRDVPVTYVVQQGGVTIGQVTLQPGTGISQTTTTPNGDPVDVLESVPNIAKDGDAWRKVDGAVHTQKVGGVTPTSVPPGGSSPPAVPIKQAPDVPTQTATNPAPGAKPVWTPVVVNNNPTAQTDLLTNAVYREGVDKTVQSAKQLTDRHEDALKANPAAGAAEGLGSSAGSQVAAIYGAAPGAPAINTTAGQPALFVTMPAKFGGATFNFDPFTNDRFSAVCGWFRSATLWLAVILLGAWVWKELGAWTRGLAGIRQAQGNAVVGGTGAQATALIAAAAITVAVIVAVVALLGWTFGEVGISVIKTTVSSNPLVSIPTGVLWMLDKLFPVSTLIVCALARVTFNMYAAPLFATCSAVIRFIVP